MHQFYLSEIRRLMIARVMIINEIVLLDEPLAALDPIFIQDIQKYILKIQSSGTAILVTDHNAKISSILLIAVMFWVNIMSLQKELRTSFLNLQKL